MFNKTFEVETVIDCGGTSTVYIVKAQQWYTKFVQFTECQLYLNKTEKKRLWRNHSEVRGRALGYEQRLEI